MLTDSGKGSFDVISVLSYAIYPVTLRLLTSLFKLYCNIQNINRKSSFFVRMVTLINTTGIIYLEFGINGVMKPFTRVTYSTSRKLGSIHTYLCICPVENNKIKSQ